MHLKNKKIKNVYPLSPLQEGLLFQSLYAPSSDTYFVQNIFEITTKVNIQALQSAWQKVSNHHDILKTGFIWQHGKKPLQYVLESVHLPFTYYDWQDVPEEIQQTKLETFIQEDRHTGFDLTKAPLFRISLIQYAPDKYHLIWSQHHLLTDGWCLPIILGDVFKSYEMITQDKEPQLNQRRPYQDYITWIQQQDKTKAEVFWKDYLAKIDTPTHLSFKNFITHDTEKETKKEYGAYTLNFSTEETEQL